jgi:hypothetical protein
MGAGFIVAPTRELEPDLLILPRELKAVGYATGMVSSHPWFNEQARLIDFFDIAARVKGSPESYGYGSFAELLPSIERFLDSVKKANAPFFLYVHAMDTHVPNRYHKGFPILPVAEQWKRYDAYDAEILYTDHHVAIVQDMLRDRGLWENTVFVFLADHGEEFGEMGPEYWNHLHGYTQRRAQVHIPLIIRFPGDKNPGTRFPSVTRQIDLAPTLLRLVMPGFDLDGFRLDGEDLTPEIRGDASPRERTSMAFTWWRYWALHEKDTEVHYDQWHDGYALHRVEVDATNYPRLVSWDGDGRGSVLTERLGRLYRDRMAEFIRMKPTYAFVQEANISIPATVHHDEGAVPTYLERDDDLWTLKVNASLDARAGESPEPIVLSTPWVPGRYRVGVRLRRGKEYRNRFDIVFPDEGSTIIEVDGPDAGSDVADVGDHVFGEVLKIKVANPVGGVSLRGLTMKLVGGDAARAKQLPADLEERLRALGYAQ